MLLECAWAGLRYNEWSRQTFARIHGGQKTRRRKAAIALARRIAVVAWTMLRDETDDRAFVIQKMTESLTRNENFTGAIALTEDQNDPMIRARGLLGILDAGTKTSD